MQIRTHELSDKLQRALEQWVELTGVDPSQKSFTIRMGGGIDDYSVSTMQMALEQALAVDHTNITAYLLLDALSSSYLSDRSFSVVELLEAPERTAEYLRKAKKFRELVHDPEIREIGNAFTLSMRQALRHYHADTPEVLHLLEDRHVLAYLRRDAFKSMEKLRVDQFLKGKHESEGATPAYNQSVHQFWNINSLIDTACRQPSGVTLNLVRDPDDFQSYFAFAIRNGGNLFILSDVPEHSHPLQRFMSRRPERSFSERACRNWFPYDLMNLEVDEEAGRIYADAKRRKNLIPLQQEVDRLKRISELAPEEIIWIVMMFSLIIERFWDKKYQAEQLSYTGQMVVEASPLIESASRSNLPVADYQPLRAARLTTSMLSDVDNGDAFGTDGGSANQWLEERYAAQVTDEDVLNIVGDSEDIYYLKAFHENNRTKDHENATVSINGLVRVRGNEDKQLPFWEKEGRYTLREFDATTFGTAKEIEDNRRFISRYNQAMAIQRLADQEYKQRKEEVSAWWSKVIHGNIDHLLHLAVQPNIWRKFDRVRFPSATFRNGRYNQQTDEYVFVVHHDEESLKETLFGLGAYAISLDQGFRERDNKYLCYLNGTGSFHHLVFAPQTADDLAFMAGCAVVDLPDILQHWCASTDHHGNHILSRIDPMAWALKNPWEDMQFKVVLRLSKRGMKKLEKGEDLA